MNRTPNIRWISGILPKHAALPHVVETLGNRRLPVIKVVPTIAASHANLRIGTTSATETSLTRAVTCACQRPMAAITSSAKL